MTDVIEAFLYDSVLEVDAVCRTIEAKSYGAAKEASEVERKVFLAGRGELLKVAILQVSRSKSPMCWRSWSFAYVYSTLISLDKDGQDRSKDRDFPPRISFPAVIPAVTAEGFDPVRRASFTDRGRNAKTAGSRA